MNNTQLSGSAAAGDESRERLVQTDRAGPSPRRVAKKTKGMANNTTVLWALIILVGIVTVAQYIAAAYSKSLALTADAIQNTVDLTTYIANLYVEYVVLENLGEHSWRVDRLNIASAIFSLIGLAGVGIYILGHALYRMNRPSHVEATTIDATLLLGFTLVGLMCDIGSLVIFSVFAQTTLEDGRKNVNMISAMAHVVTDFIRSLFVAGGALLIYFQQTKIINWNVKEDQMDAILSLLIVACIFSASFFLLREILHLTKHGDHRIKLLRCQAEKKEGRMDVEI